MRISDWSSDICSSDLIDRKSAKRSPVAPGIFKERRSPRYPNRARVAAVPLVPNDRSAFAALAHARPVADEETHAIGGAFGILDQQVAGGVGDEPARQVAREGIACVDDRFELGVGQRLARPLLEERTILG